MNSLNTTQRKMFLRGPSLSVRFILFTSMCIALMLLDSRYQQLEKIRSAASTMVYPLRVAANTPYKFSNWFSNSLRTRKDLRQENSQLRLSQQTSQFELQRFQQLEAENHRLRVLLESAQAQELNLQMAEIMRVSLDPGRHHVILNQGAQLGINKGQVVIDAEGLMGQIIRTDLLQSEAVLITDSNHVTPIEVNRNGLRNIAYGNGDDKLLHLPYFAQNSELKEGDLLVTSGLGGRFPVGIPVAKIMKINRDPSKTFLDVYAEPIAALDQSRLVAVVKNDDNFERRKARTKIPTDTNLDTTRTEIAKADTTIAKPIPEETETLNPTNVSH